MRRRHSLRSKLLLARKMRLSPTYSEALLWEHLRRKQLGFEIRRQVIVLGWIADFYCPAARLVIEVDGGSHLRRVRADGLRDRVMRARGFRVLRLPASLVEQDMSEALRRIRLHLP